MFDLVGFQWNIPFITAYRHGAECPVIELVSSVHTDTSHQITDLDQPVSTHLVFKGVFQRFVSNTYDSFYPASPLHPAAMNQNANLIPAGDSAPSKHVR